MTSPRLTAAANSTRTEAEVRVGRIPDFMPWKVHPGIVTIGPYNKGLMVGPAEIAVIHVIGAFEKADVGPDARATAAEIVRRWNSHAALLAALEKWEAYGANNGGEENYSFLAETRTAIAAAKAGAK